MAKFKSKQGETMTWLEKCGVMVSFKDGIAEVTDKKQVEEMKSRGYIDTSFVSPIKTIPSK